MKGAPAKAMAAISMDEEVTGESFEYCPYMHRYWLWLFREPAVMNSSALNSAWVNICRKAKQGKHSPKHMIIRPNFSEQNNIDRLIVNHFPWSINQTINQYTFKYHRAKCCSQIRGI